MIDFVQCSCMVLFFSKYSLHPPPLRKSVIFPLRSCWAWPCDLVLVHVGCGGSGPVPVRSRDLKVHWCGHQPSTLGPAWTREMILLHSGCKAITGHVTQTCSHHVPSKSWGARNPVKLGGFSQKKRNPEPMSKNTHPFNKC